MPFIDDVEPTSVEQVTTLIAEFKAFLNKQGIDCLVKDIGFGRVSIIIVMPFIKMTDEQFDKNLIISLM